jgi:hypothetical protein
VSKRLHFLGLILAFSFCYTEWGGGQSAFIVEMELEFFASVRKNLSAFGYPLILAGLLGQLGLIYGMMVPKPRFWIIAACLAFLSLVVGFFSLAGLLSLNFKIIGSTIPFWVLVWFWFRTGKSSQKNPENPA